VHFYEQNATNSLIVLGRDNPTRASSEAPDHSGRFANDGNPATFWQADAGDTNASFRVDLERVVTVSKIKLTFPTPGTWRYKIGISDNGDSWKLLTDQANAGSTSAERTDVIPAGSPAGRFVRISIVESPAGQSAALAEVEVFATQLAP
jgi:beta-galactosidase